MRGSLLERMAESAMRGAASEIADCVEISADREKAYEDRNTLALVFVALIADRRGEEHVGWYDHGDDGWAVIYAETAAGQVSWHVPEEDVPEWLPERDATVYDGHDREQKNERLRSLVKNHEDDD